MINRPEQELRKSREELQVIHSINATRASMDECINENYNPQRKVSATSVDKPKDPVLRDKTSVVHHGTPPKKNKGAARPRRQAHGHLSDRDFLQSTKAPI